MQGQMWPAERNLLYQAIVESRPKTVIEIGTWYGGGSTTQIINGLQSNDKGHLHTCEVDEAKYNSAKSGYNGNNFVTFHLMESTKLLHKLIADNNVPDFAFFDGPEDPELNLNDFKLWNAHAKPGFKFCMHDWDLGVRADGMVSTKAELLRPYLENHKDWKIIRQLTAPESVGIVLAVKQ